MRCIEGAVRRKPPGAARRNRTACAVLLIACLALAAASADGADDFAQTYARQIQPLLVRSCGKCHGKMPKDNDLDLTSFGSAQTILARPKMLSDVAERVGGGDMPPKDAPQPSQAESEQLLGWITAVLDAEAAARAGDPGLLPGAVSSKVESGAWTSSNPAVLFAVPVIVNDCSAARKGFEWAFELQGWRPTLDKPNMQRPADGIPQDIGEHMRIMEQLAYIARKLDAIQEGPRTLLDNTMLMHCSSMMAGAKHDNDQLPIIVLGGAGGRLKGGRALDYKDKPDRQLCRFFMSMMDKMDVHPETFGEAKTTLEEV